MTQSPPIAHQVIWLTGASSGIGEALVSALAPICHTLYISARNQEKLEALAKPWSNVYPLVADITSEPSMLTAAEQIKHQHGRLDTLIANAGTCEYVDVENFDTQLFRRVFDTNLMGTINSVAVALPLLQESQRGYLVGVSSSVTRLAMPRAQAYGASKAAMTHFLEAMKADLAHMNIDVSVVSPGFVKTPLTDLNDFPMPMRITAEEAAEEIIKGIKKRQWHIHFPKKFTGLLGLLGILPPMIRHKITQKMSLVGKKQTAKGSQP